MDCRPPSVAGEAHLPCSRVPVGRSREEWPEQSRTPRRHPLPAAGGGGDVHPMCETPGLAEQPGEVAQTRWGSLLIFHLLKVQQKLNED